MLKFVSSCFKNVNSVSIVFIANVKFGVLTCVGAWGSGG